MKKILILSLLFFLSGCTTRVPAPSRDLNQSPASPTSKPGIQYCAPKDVQASLTLDPGAGNVYGSLKIKNISNQHCNIAGDTYVMADYNTQIIKNISIEKQGKVESSLFQLEPNQILYSQLHYPNGPQCGGLVKSAMVSFRYAISPTETITFTDQTGNQSIGVSNCLSDKEITTIQVWNMSAEPITK